MEHAEKSLLKVMVVNGAQHTGEGKYLLQGELTT